MRCAAAVEATVYFVVAEALTNVGPAQRRRRASHVVVRRRRTRRRRRSCATTARVAPDEGGGTGLAGIRRRVEAMDGRWSLASPPGGPTELRVEVPCGS